MPRHPPCALHSLSQQRQNKSLQKKHTHTHHNQGTRGHKKYTTKHSLMLASTMQISNNNPTNPHHHTTAQQQAKGGTNQKHPTHHRRLTPQQTSRRPDASGPNSVPTLPPPEPTPFHTPTTRASSRDTGSTRRRPHQGSSIIDDSTSEHHHRCTDIRCQSGRVLLRKEVIQPHLPVRLPCYDFVPIASPTFDGSLHKGWATGFGCCRLS